MEAILFVVLWWGLSATAIASMTFAYFQGEFPLIAEEGRTSDSGTAWAMGMMAGILGPLGVLFVFLMTGYAKHGVRFPRP